MSPALPFAARHHCSGRTMPGGATVAKRRGPRMAIGQAWRWIALAWMCGAGWVGSSLAVAQGLSPREAISKMKLPPGWQVEVVASEPLARQPVAIDFDDRGRLWVLQYLQYPNPEGLQRVQVDRFSRTRYDRVPEPPPKGPRGADRLTIVTDSNGDGVADEARDFIDGLNLASGFAFGHGGVFVLNVPYLLFYPDRNRDDVPDSDPQVLLTGFGMEDAHSVANSLTFGPDGWLYGCQGSTVTAQVRGHEFQQGIWRYHPATDRFELFCEGGGNSWGLDFDATGRLLYSTNYGGHTLLHAVQGGYFVKSFGKHGALHNPHAYGYFDHAPHANFQGGHVTVGGIVYQETLFPPEFRGNYLAGDLLGHGVYWHTIAPRGTTVQTAHGGELLVANDPWFAPTDVTVGPEGALYVADWHDARTAHPDPDAEWDRTNGRIYRLTPRQTPPIAPFDLARLSLAELRDRLSHASQWHVRRARQELVRRRHLAVDQPLSAEFAALIADLSRGAQSSPEQGPALEALWTVASLNAFTPELGGHLLESPHPAVRAWSVRLLGDLPQLPAALAARLDILAEREAAS
ncbi:MAG: PVC-type heme-binding CxxCH protein, partial [Planctomycetaceae bacterium]